MGSERGRPLVHWAKASEVKGLTSEDEADGGLGIRVEEVTGAEIFDQL